MKVNDKCDKLVAKIRFSFNCARLAQDHSTLDFLSYSLFSCISCMRLPLSAVVPTGVPTAGVISDVDIVTVLVGFRKKKQLESQETFHVE